MLSLKQFIADLDGDAAADCADGVVCAEVFGLERRGRHAAERAADRGARVPHERALGPARRARGARHRGYAAKERRAGMIGGAPVFSVDLLARAR